MKNFTKKLTSLLIFLTFVAGAFNISYAQQLPNASFEAWNSTWNDEPQPDGWNLSNVEQMGIKFNVGERSTKAHTGSYSVLCQDTDLKVMGIGETSPSWVTLGTPWAYVESLTKISEATAGTDGGVDFSYRPDTLTVWVIRESAGNEDINLVYYAWNGQTRADKYKGKDGNCTSTTHYNEESDIRQTTDKNQCGTAVTATQISEGFLRTRATYANWTQLRIPINYYSNDVPSKMNIILSASNYPNQRANDGLYTTSKLYVDDVALVYSSKAYTMSMDGLKFGKFDPNVYEYTYEIAKGSAVPDITCTRSGRLLQGSEIEMVKGEVGGSPTVITIKAEDGSSTTTYKVNFVYTRSTNSKAAMISVNGTPISGFNSAVTTYDVELPYGTTEFPQIDVKLSESHQTYSVTSCEIPGTAYVTVYAENPDYSTTYTLNFTTGKLTDTTLEAIYVNGNLIPGYTPTKTVYKCNLPVGTTESAEITYKSKYDAGVQTVKIKSIEKFKGTQIDSIVNVNVSVPDATTRTYKISFEIKASDYSYLSDLRVGGTTIEGFDPETFKYSYSLPIGTTTLPKIEWTQGDAYQTVTKEEGGVDGTTKITVMAQDGVSSSIYRIAFSTEKSSNSLLQSIKVAGVELEGFDPLKTDYSYVLPVGTTELPEITWVKGDEYQTVTLTKGSVNGLTRITVKAQDGSTTAYGISFSVTKADISTLLDIQLDGTSLEGFAPETFAYSIALPRGTKTLPEITWTKHDEYQTVNKVEGGVNGVTKITVKAQAGAVSVYELTFSVPKSSNAQLSDIKLDGETIEGFASDVYAYKDTLPSGTTELPEITYTKGDDMQSVYVTTGGVNGTTKIDVTAEDGTKAQYTIAFAVRKSENAFLQNIKVGGIDLEGFEPTTLEYTYTLSDDATVCPAIEVEKGEGQTVKIVAPYLTGKAKIEVTPESGSKNTYTIDFQFNRSSNSKLADIAIDGVTIEGFDPDVTSYSYVMPQGSKVAPVITFTKGDERQTVELSAEAIGYDSKLVVMAEDGSTTTYTINITAEKGSSATLADLKIDGTSIEGFASETFDYTYIIVDDATALPAIEPVKEYAEQSISTITPALTGKAVITVTSEDGGATRDYTITFAYAKKSEADVADIKVDGLSIPEFAPEIHEYTIVTENDGKPVVEVVKGNEYQTIVITANIDSADVISNVDLATSVYKINYVRNPKTSALLSDLQIYNSVSKSYVSIEDFTPEQADYSYALALGTSDVPMVNAVPGTKGQFIKIDYSKPNGTTTVFVKSQDGEETKTYTIAFPVAKATGNTLTSITVGGADVPGFDPETYSYDLELAYGTKAVPQIGYQKADERSLVTLTAGSLFTASSVKVTSESGEENTYTLNFTVAKSTSANTLKGLTVNGDGVPGFSADTHTYTVALHQSLEGFQSIGYVKNYEEQTVLVDNAPDKSVVTVKSNLSGIADAVYTINYKYESGSYLSDIKADGATISGYDRDTHIYVLQVTEKPTITFTAPANVEASLSTDNAQGCVIECTNTQTTEKCSYNIYFHYTNDVIPNDDFTEWTKPAHTDVSSAVKPVGWNCPADAKGKDDVAWAAYLVCGSRTGYAGYEIENKNNTVARVKSDHYQCVLAGPLPAVMTLGTVSCTIKEASGSSVGFSGGITFRNTPEIARIRYAYPSKNNGALFAFRFFDESGTETSKDITFTNESSDYTVYDHALNLGDLRPAMMNIAINPNGDEWSGLIAGDYGKVDVDYIKFIYNSAIASVKANGADAVISGNTITAEIEAEAYGKPVLDITGEVSDQRYDVTMWEETAGAGKKSRAIAIRAYAEDGTYTDYNMTVDRPNSTVNTLSGISIDGTPLADFSAEKTSYDYYYANGQRFAPSVSYDKGSAHQSVAVAIDLSKAVLTVSAESGTKKEYTINFIESKSDVATLSNISVEGYEIAFTPETREYEVTFPVKTAIAPLITFTKQSDGQIVVLSESAANGIATLDVTAEDGTTTGKYTVAFAVAPAADSESKLEDIDIFDSPSGGIEYSKDQFEYNYTIALTEADPVTVYSKIEIEDTLSVALTDDSVVWNVKNYASGTANEYKLFYTKQLSDNALLQAINVDATLVEGFDAHIKDYIVKIARGSHVTIEAVAAEADENVVTTVAGNLYTFSTLAENGSTTDIYTLTVDTLLNTSALLNNIYVDGTAIEGFRPDSMDYVVELPVGTAVMPDIKAEAAEYGQVCSYRIGSLDQQSFIDVVSEDGLSTSTYSVLVSVKKSDNADLKAINANYTLIADYDPATIEYTVVIPSGGTVPVISYIKGESMQIVETVADETMTQFNVTAENGETVKTYTVNYNFNYSTDAHLADIKLDNVSVEGFDPETFVYSVELPVGTKRLPDIEPRPNATGQTITVVDGGVNGKTVITTLAEDGLTSLAYEIDFTVKLSEVDTLKNIFVNGEAVADFKGSVTEYNVSLPVGTRTMPVITVEVGDEYQTYTVNTTQADTYSYKSVIVAKSQSGKEKEYTVDMTVLKSANSQLQMIYANGAELEDFTPGEYKYTFSMPIGSDPASVVFDYKAGDDFQTVDVNREESKVTYSVTAENGTSTSTYTVDIYVKKSEIVYLNDIQYDGNSIEGFDRETLSYSVMLPIGTTEAPVVTWTEGDEYQTVTLRQSENQMSDTIHVVAGSGDTRDYIVDFTVEKSHNAHLASLTVDGEYVVVPSFDREVFDYTVKVPYGTASVPATSWELEDAAATAVLSQAAAFDETTTVTVTAEDGETFNIYSLNYTVLPDTVCTLAKLGYDETWFSDFSSDKFEYNVTLPYGTVYAPTIIYEAVHPETEDVEVTVTEGSDVSFGVKTFNAVIEVTAEDGAHANTYTIAFKVAGDSRLQKLIIKGEELKTFNPDKSEYNIEFAAYTDSTALPKVEDITYVKFDENATVSVVVSETDKGEMTITVKAAQVDPHYYIIKTTIKQSDNTELKSLSVAGALINGFDPTLRDYVYKLPFGAQAVDTAKYKISYELAEPKGQKAEIQRDDIDFFKWYVVVTAQNGDLNRYAITFTPDTFDPATEPDDTMVCITSTSDGGWKFTTKCNNVMVILTDLKGAFLATTTLPLVDPNVTEICAPEAEGFTYYPVKDQIVTFNFLHAQKKRVLTGKMKGF